LYGYLLFLCCREMVETLWWSDHSSKDPYSLNKVWENPCSREVGAVPLIAVSVCLYVRFLSDPFTNVPVIICISQLEACTCPETVVNFELCFWTCVIVTCVECCIPRQAKPCEQNDVSRLTSLAKNIEWKRSLTVVHKIFYRPLKLVHFLQFYF